MLAKTVTVTLFSPYNYPVRTQEVRRKEGEAISKPGLSNSRVCVLTTILCTKHHPEFPPLPISSLHPILGGAGKSLPVTELAQFFKKSL